MLCDIDPMTHQRNMNYERKIKEVSNNKNDMMNRKKIGYVYEICQILQDEYAGVNGEMR